MKYIVLFILITSLSILSCTDDTPPSVNPNPAPPVDNVWLIPQNQVFDGGPGKDGIPSVDNPQFSPIDEIDFLNNDDLILGIKVGDVIKAYPHPILDWHEIVNDEIGIKSIALTYCPLTGTGIGWDRVVEGIKTTFGVSGLLYETNLMPYDRATNSTWSQQRLDCVNGTNLGINATLHSFIETTWGTWKEAFPESLIMNTNTGFSRNYTRYPYGSYRTNESLLFPISTDDDLLPRKERVLGVRVNSEFKAYPFGDSGSGNELIKDNFNQKDLMIVRNTERNFIVAFKDTPTDLSFEIAEESEFPAILKDQDGATYDLFGSASMTDKHDLILADQMIGYWFSWGTFYPGLDLYE